MKMHNMTIKAKIRMPKNILDSSLDYEHKS